MAKQYQLVIFDWEGTIADTLGVILHTVAEEADRLGFGAIDYIQARKFVDLGLVQAVKKIFPHLDIFQHEQLLQSVQNAMIAKPAEVRLIPGALEFIHRLRAAGIDIAVATNKGQQSLMRALQATELDQFFLVTRCAGQVPTKPCPQMLEEILAEFGYEVSSALMIGDTAEDMEMAKNIHMDAIGVDFYHQQRSVLIDAGALEVFNDYAKLAEYIGIPKMQEKE